MGLRVLTGSAAHLRLVYIFGEGRSNFRSAENKESPIHVYSGWFGQFMSIHVLGVFFYYFLQYFLQPEDQKRERESLCLFFPFVLRPSFPRPRAAGAAALRRGLRLGGDRARGPERLWMSSTRTTKRRTKGPK